MIYFGLWDGQKRAQVVLKWERGLTLVGVRAQLEQLPDTFMSYFGFWGGQKSSS
jgi:hypothetical protein